MHRDSHAQNIAKWAPVLQTILLPSCTECCWQSISVALLVRNNKRYSVMPSRLSQFAQRDAEGIPRRHMGQDTPGAWTGLVLSRIPWRGLMEPHAARGRDLYRVLDLCPAQWLLPHPLVVPDYACNHEVSHLSTPIPKCKLQDCFSRLKRTSNAQITEAKL